MRKETIECTSWSTARRRASWAATFRRVEGGWLAFESVTDAAIWDRQK